MQKKTPALLKFVNVLNFEFASAQLFLAVRTVVQLCILRCATSVYALQTKEFFLFGFFYVSCHINGVELICSLVVATTCTHVTHTVEDKSWNQTVQGILYPIVHYFQEKTGF